jgi:hypothetical protein
MDLNISVSLIELAMLTRCDEANDRYLIDPEVETMTRVAAQQLFLRDYRWGACDLQSFTF